MAMPLSGEHEAKRRPGQESNMKITKARSVVSIAASGVLLLAVLFGSGCGGNNGASATPPEPKAQYEQQVRSLTASVRMMVNWPQDTAVPGTAMASFLALQGKTEAECTDFTYILMGQFVANHIVARARSIFLTGTRSESHSILEYWDPYLDKWVVTDPTFGVIFTDENATVGQSVEDINQLVLAKQFEGIHMQFLTGYGDQIARAYYMDMITYYTNYSQPCLANCPFYGYPYLDSNGNYPSQYATRNPPEEFLIQQPATIVGTAGVYILKFASTADSVTIVNGSNTSTIQPMNNTLFSYSVGLDAGWTMTGNATIYTFARPVFPFYCPFC